MNQRQSTPMSQTTFAGSKRRLKLWLLVVLLFSAWVIYALLNQLDQQYATEARLAAAQERLALAQQYTSELEQRIIQMDDPEYIQEVARKEYNMHFLGEQRIQVDRPNQ